MAKHKNAEQWGKETAKARHGGKEGGLGDPQMEAQKNQCPEYKHGPGYENDTPDNWLRGKGMKPGFDRHKAGR